MKSDELSLIESKTGVVLPNSYKQALLNYPETLIGTEAEDFHFLTNANEIISENLEEEKMAILDKSGQIDTL
ncbi:hypothetical protein ACUMO5_004577 [Vibrio parahaemolyticus]|nr:hypothetical protein [Vibrio parahaemolyticus]EIC2575805.1 hypothetical protein [Vibrio parahaemolyticus]EID0039476.1 hypothetical protein [Vibrio parahaemolyticus]ELA9363911.1 hypothetical protein [Vibrio parahaemolyticus]MBM4914611.1 hypothetical protein [Vibrio parahaemolyticus]